MTTKVPERVRVMIENLLGYARVSGAVTWRDGRTGDPAEARQEKQLTALLAELSKAYSVVGVARGAWLALYSTGKFTSMSRKLANAIADLDAGEGGEP